MAPDQRTLAVALVYAVERLAAASSTPQLDAELLLQAVTGHARGVTIAFPETALNDDQWRRYSGLVARRELGEPMGYLLGKQEFWSLVLEVTPAVLIPRPETELVVERALRHLSASDAAKFLDLATGSGAIALAVASELPQVQVVASDLSDEALNVARRNARRLGLDRVHFVAGNWFDAVANERYGCIASNPPYIAANDPDLAPSVRAHEPTMALIAGSYGMECLEQIVLGAPDHLEQGGWLVLEHGWQQAGKVRNMLEGTGFTHVTSHADLAGHLRVTEGRWPGKRVDSGQRTADSTDSGSNSD